MTAKRSETDARRRYVDQFAVANRSFEARNVVNDHLTGGTQEDIFDLKNFLSHVYWTFDLRSSLCIINLSHSYRGMKRHCNLFCCNPTLFAY